MLPQTECPSPATRYRLYSGRVVGLYWLLWVVGQLEVVLPAVEGLEVEAGLVAADAGLDGDEMICSVLPLQRRW